GVAGAEEAEPAPAEADLVAATAVTSHVRHWRRLTSTPERRSPGARALRAAPGPPPARARAGRGWLPAPRAARSGTPACGCRDGGTRGAGPPGRRDRRPSDAARTRAQPRRSCAGSGAAFSPGPAPRAPGAARDLLRSTSSAPARRAPGPG